MKILVALCVLFAAASSFAATPSPDDDDECGYRTRYDGTVFALSIGRSFDPGAEFMLCARREPKDSFLLVYVYIGDEKDNRSERKIVLNETTYGLLVALYEDALTYDVKDATLGLDGSTWCLETRRGFTYSKACFWSPEYEARKRGLIALHKLGAKLWKLAKLKPEIGDLY